MIEVLSLGFWVLVKSEDYPHGIALPKGGLSAHLELVSERFYIVIETFPITSPLLNLPLDEIQNFPQLKPEELFLHFLKIITPGTDD